MAFIADLCRWWPVAMRSPAADSRRPNDDGRPTDARRRLFVGNYAVASFRRHYDELPTAARSSSSPRVQPRMYAPRQTIFSLPPMHTACSQLRSPLLQSKYTAKTHTNHEVRGNNQHVMWAKYELAQTDESAVCRIYTCAAAKC